MNITYKVLTPDVWGNQEEGYDSNDTRFSGYLIAPSDTDDDIFNALIEKNYLSLDAVLLEMGELETDANGVYIDDLGGCGEEIWIREASNDMPLYILQEEV